MVVFDGLVTWGWLALWLFVLLLRLVCDCLALQKFAEHFVVGPFQGLQVVFGEV